MNEQEYRKHFQNPAWVAYLSPFTLIIPDDEEPLKVDLEEINTNTYDHGKLCRIVTKLSIQKFSFELLVCCDGALAIPKTGKFSGKERAVDFFNTLLCKLLIGGIFCEAIDRRDVVSGRLHDKKFIWPVDFGQSASTHLHSKLRMRLAGNIDSIILSDPKFIRVSEFHKLINTGDSVLTKIPNLTPKFLIRGITEIKYKNWDLVLSNLWITVEQLIDFLWNYHFLKNDNFHPSDAIDGRKSSFKDDNRTWSTSVKQEILFQAKVIDEEIIYYLFPARKARNKLVHEGKSVSEVVANGLYKAINLLISKSLNNSSFFSFGIDGDFRGSEMDNSNFNESYFYDWNELTKSM